jgi:type IV secretory pathway TrbF-like protein
VREPLLSLSKSARRLRPEAPLSPVHQAARREFSEVWGVHIQQARAWKWTAFGCIAVALVAVGGVAWIGAQSKIVPYVVQTDRLGDAIAIRRADVAAPLDPRILRAQLARWVWDIRTVSTDAAAEKHFITGAYAMTDRRGAAATQLNDWFAAHNPFKRAADDMVGVAIESVLPISGHTWRVEWREETRTRGGTLESSRNWEATITVSVNPPATDSEILSNPTGLYVEAFSWSAYP